MYIYINDKNHHNIHRCHQSKWQERVKYVRAFVVTGRRYGECLPALRDEVI